MKIRKEYTYKGKGQIWRLVPAEPDKLVIENRNTETKEVFFTCLKIKSGKTLFKDFQFEEKFWIGIETVKDDLIFFNKYLKPDMPQHKGIIAFDINEQKVIWENENYVFLFLKDDSLYCYIQKFEGRSFYILHYKTGKLLQDLGGDAAEINIIREEALSTSAYAVYYFPEPFNESIENDTQVKKIIDQLKTEKVITGKIHYLKLGKAIFLNYFEVNREGKLNNIFKTIDIDSEKTIFEEVLSENSKTVVPDSFYIKDNFLFLLKEKIKLLVCSIKN